jgi:hypothetical protein
MYETHRIAVLFAACIFYAPFVSAETFEDKLISTPATPEVLAKGLEAPTLIRDLRV